MRAAWVLAATAACGFQHGILAPEDAPGDAALDAAPDTLDVTPVAGYCDPSPTLIACYSFEGTAQDASGHSLDATTQNVSFVAGKVGMAMQFDTTSAADVADSPLLDPGAITIEAWIQPSQLPTTGLRFGVVDNNGQWGVFVHENGRLQCTMVGGPSLQVDAGIMANVWTHVACTYDGSATTIYSNGALVGMGTGGSTLATGGATGISIAADNPPGAGSRLVGLIDELRILNVARSAADICADAQCAN